MSRTFAILLLSGCAASTAAEKGGPRGLRADQHLAIGSRESARADDLTHWPDTRSAIDTGDPASHIGVWLGSWDTTEDHRRLARYHRSAAAELEAEYEQACGETGIEAASMSPVQRFGIGGSPIANGTLVLLVADAGPPDKLLAAMRCHRAWMMLGKSNMDDCPLDLPGLHVDARGDANGIELSMTVADPALVDELRRRAAHDLEAAQRPPKP